MTNALLYPQPASELRSSRPIPEPPDEATKKLVLLHDLATKMRDQLEVQIGQAASAERRKTWGRRYRPARIGAEVQFLALLNFPPHK
jgi:hypothetical protein